MLAITGGRLHTVSHGVIETGTVLMDGSTIVALGPDLEVPAGARLLDAAGCDVYPGMVDAHTHLGVFAELSGPVGADGNEMSDPITPQVRALDGLQWSDPGFQDAVASGVTTAHVVPGSANLIGGQGVVVKTWGRRSEDRIVLQPSGLKMALGENPKRVYGSRNETPATRLGSAALMREAFVQARNYARRRETSDADPDLKWDIVAKVLAGELDACCHAHRADDIMTALRISQEFGFRLRIEHCTEGLRVAGELAAAGVHCTLGPLMSGRSKQELKDRTLEAAAALEQAGVVFAFVTDHPVVPVYSLPLCAAYAVGAGMSPSGAVRALTLDAARVLGLDSRLGSLEVGKDADCFVADGDILDPRSRVLTTVVDGEVAWSTDGSLFPGEGRHPGVRQVSGIQHGTRVPW